MLPFKIRKINLFNILEYQKYYLNFCNTYILIIVKKIVKKFNIWKPSEDKSIQNAIYKM